MKPLFGVVFSFMAFPDPVFALSQDLVIYEVTKILVIFGKIVFDQEVI